MTTYIEDIGGGRQRELGPADDEGDGGQALHGVAGDHKLGDRKGKAVERPLEPRRRASPLFLGDSVLDLAAQALSERGRKTRLPYNADQTRLFLLESSPFRHLSS